MGLSRLLSHVVWVIIYLFIIIMEYLINLPHPEYHHSNYSRQKHDHHMERD